MVPALESHRHLGFGGEQIPVVRVRGIAVGRHADIVHPNIQLAVVIEHGKGHAFGAVRRVLDGCCAADILERAVHAPGVAILADDLHAVAVLALIVAHGQRHKHVVAVLIAEHEPGAGIYALHTGQGQAGRRVHPLGINPAVHGRRFQRRGQALGQPVAQLVEIPVIRLKGGVPHLAVRADKAPNQRDVQHAVFGLAHRNIGRHIAVRRHIKLSTDVGHTHAVGSVAPQWERLHITAFYEPGPGPVHRRAAVAHRAAQRQRRRGHLFEHGGNGRVTSDVGDTVVRPAVFHPQLRGHICAVHPHRLGIPACGGCHVKPIQIPVGRQPGTLQPAAAAGGQVHRPAAQQAFVSGLQPGTTQDEVAKRRAILPGLEAHGNLGVSGKERLAVLVHGIQIAANFLRVYPDVQLALGVQHREVHARRRIGLVPDRAVLLDVLQGALPAPGASVLADHLDAVVVLPLFVVHGQRYKHVVAFLVIEDEAGAGIPSLLPGQADVGGGEHRVRENLGVHHRLVQAAIQGAHPVLIQAIEIPALRVEFPRRHGAAGAQRQRAQRQIDRTARRRSRRIVGDIPAGLGVHAQAAHRGRLHRIGAICPRQDLPGIAAHNRKSRSAFHRLGAVGDFPFPNRRVLRQFFKIGLHPQVLGDVFRPVIRDAVFIQQIGHVPAVHPDTPGVIPVVRHDLYDIVVTVHHAALARERSVIAGNQGHVVGDQAVLVKSPPGGRLRPGGAAVLHPEVVPLAFFVAVGGQGADDGGRGVNRSRLFPAEHAVGHKRFDDVALAVRRIHLAVRFDGGMQLNRPGAVAAALIPFDRGFPVGTQVDLIAVAADVRRALHGRDIQLDAAVAGDVPSLHTVHGGIPHVEREIQAVGAVIAGHVHRDARIGLHGQLQEPLVFPNRVVQNAVQGDGGVGILKGCS